jgi:hypothetical protein
MWGKKSWKDMVRGWAWQGFGVAIIAVFAGYALFGANGVLAWGEYSQRLSAHRIELAKLEKERDILRHRVDLVETIWPAPRPAKPPFYVKPYSASMLLIRRFEEKAGQLYGLGLIGGFCHLYIGQEAVAVGLQSALDAEQGQRHHRLSRSRPHAGLWHRSARSSWPN